MATNVLAQPSASAWNAAKGLMPVAQKFDKGPHAALIPDGQDENDHIAVVYDKGDTPPKITIEQVSGSVHTVWADNVAIAVVASATGRPPVVEDVLLVERST